MKRRQRNLAVGDGADIGAGFRAFGLLGERAAAPVVGAADGGGARLQTGPILPPPLDGDAGDLELRQIGGVDVEDRVRRQGLI